MAAAVRQEVKRGGALSPLSCALAPSNPASRPSASKAPSAIPRPSASQGAAAPSAPARSTTRPLTCVLHVTPGSELALCRRVAKVAQDHLSDCYVPQSQLPMRIQGVWEFRDSILFPGYIFLETQAADLPALEADLGLITDYHRLLRTEGGVSVLTPDEAQAVQALCGPTHYIPTSYGTITAGQLHVSRGPLKGREHSVVKIDRHPRCAYVRAGLLGRASVRVGLEVPTKT